MRETLGLNVMTSPRYVWSKQGPFESGAVLPRPCPWLHSHPTYIQASPICTSHIAPHANKGPLPMLRTKATGAKWIEG